jgi:hypothetical protein
VHYQVREAHGLDQAATLLARRVASQSIPVKLKALKLLGDISM